KLSGAAWLAVTPAGPLTVTPAGSQMLTFTVTSSSLAPGNYTETVRVADGNATNNPGDITVNVTVGAPAVMTLTPASLNNYAVFRTKNPSPNTQTITLQNTGSSTMTSWTATANMLQGSGWLSVSPASGTNLGAGASVIATIHSTPGGTPLGAGPYTGPIAVADPNASNNGAATSTRAVQLPVSPSLATLCVSPASLAFGNVQRNTTSASQTLVFRNV